MSRLVAVQDVLVAHLVDLDDLAARLHTIVKEWTPYARVGPLTWRDERTGWPQPIVSDRAIVEVPESLGIRLWRDPGDEFVAVVWVGGWADVAFLVDGEVISLCPEFQDVDGAYAAVVQNVEDFLA